MKHKSAIFLCIAGGWALASAAGALQLIPEHGFLSADMAIAADPEAGADAPDARLYADGTKAIREGRWADAVSIFDRVANEKSDHAAGALYWKAYAQNKQGQGDKTLETCGALRQQFARSSWVEDCGALEIEVHARNGQTVQPKPGQSDELKLLAIANLMERDPKKARAQIDEILAGDSSERLREGALFLLGETVPESTYAQIVRVSFLEGDVRIARAAENEKSKTPVWENAVMGLPLTSGDSLVTGKDGRAEIELEDASTVYLGGNSVLNLQDLHTTSGVPHTEMGLVSGTLTLHLDSLMAGEAFLLRSPVDQILTRYPDRLSVRVSSYSDGTAVMPLVAGGFRTETGPLAISPGKPLFYNQDHRLVPMPDGKIEDLSAWDAWVADRYSVRKAAVAEVMRGAGLDAPIPGLADMKGQGTFFDCPPYGTCWAPKAATQPLSNALATGTQPVTVHTHEATPTTQTVVHPQTTTPGTVAYVDYFPCLPEAIADSWYSRDALWARHNITGIGLEMTFDPYAWAVCHAGSWIPYNNHGYAWVVGRKRIHEPPVRWVKTGGRVAFVPIHPRDVKGQAPLNREHAIVVDHQKGNLNLSMAKIESGSSMHVMKAPPHEFRNQPAPVLARAETPHMFLNSAKEIATVKPGMARPTGTAINFDHRSQSFAMPHQVMQGNRAVTVNAPVGHVGGPAQGHPGGLNGGTGARGGGGVSGGAVSHSSNTSVSSSPASSSVSSSSSVSASRSSTVSAPASSNAGSAHR